MSPVSRPHPIVGIPVLQLFLLSAGLSLTALCLAASPARAQYTYADINAPMADPFFFGTMAKSISNNGQIVGTYYDTTHHGHGFVETSNTFVTADYSNGALFTTPTGINDVGQIVGHYTDASGISGSYFENGGVYTAVEDPNGYSGTTFLSGINDSGQIVGTYNAPGSGPFAVAVGFVDTGGIFTNLNVPGIAGAVPTAINNSGQIAGDYSGANGSTHGFLDTGGIVTTLDVPGAAQTSVTGLNDAGQIVGTYTDTTGNQHGFIKIGSLFATVDDPNAAPGPFTYNKILSYVTGINNADQIVGYYFDAHDYHHGFEATPAAVPEASTTVSFGLLLALGMGGIAVTARKKKVSAAI